ncbi:hypothetical protein PS2_001589 [Malus domestica]|uniref:uncharacterized protein isoform X1 n=1 Tax=Malus domestica TaxID=3750 RepID=UPI0039755F90
MASTTSTQNGSHQWLRPFGVPNGRSIDANRETGFDKKLLRGAVKKLLKICAFRFGGGAPTMVPRVRGKKRFLGAVFSDFALSLGICRTPKWTQPSMRCVKWVFTTNPFVLR